MANLTHEDAHSFFDVVPQAGIATRTRVYPLGEDNAAISAHRSGTLRGAAVLVP